MNPVISTIFEAFAARGSARYGSEGVTQLEHALQSGHLAMQAGADNCLVAAALLHDVGHILGDDKAPVDGDANLDDLHESKGYDFLCEHFGRAVADPVRLHVVAKRYLCTKNPAYEGKLSPTSLQSYHDQGGPMTPAEIEAFEAEPHFRAALKLRHWDDAAKIPDAVTPPIGQFESILTESLRD